MNAVVLTEVEGTRLKELTDERTKALVKVDGRPIVEDVLDNLLELGVEELVVVMGHTRSNRS